MITTSESSVNADDQDIDLADLRLLGQGRTAEIYRYQGNRVIKLFRKSFPVQAIENEYLVCRAIQSSLDIPSAHRRLIIDGREAILFDFVDGVSGFKFIFQKPWSLKSFAREFAALHVKMHFTPVTGPIPALTDILTRNINLRDLLDRQEKDGTIEYLHKLPSGTALCHGDYHPDNIMISGGKPIILDWMTATRGNALADVARTSVLLKWAQPGPGTPAVVKILLSSTRRKFYATYLERYLELTNARAEDVAQWELPVLAARLMEWIPAEEKKLILSEIHRRLKEIRISKSQISIQR